MKPEIKEKWDEALRSGIYPQGKMRLYDGTNYCCLGVLCKLYLEATDQNWDFVEGDINGISILDVFYIDDESEILPDVVREWAGIEVSCPEVVISNPETEQNMKVGLISLNDDLDYTFPQIADLIRAQL